MATPKLRFKEFNNDLDVESLNDIVVFSKGKGLSKADISSDGKNPCIRYGELYTTYGQVIDNIISKTNIKKSDCILSQAGDVIIPASGETQIDIATAACVLHDGIILSGDLNILSHKENGAWLAYYLSSAKKLEMARFAQGNSVVHLYSRQLKDIKINKPSLKEQTKIATFLSAIDTKIDELTQKHELLTDYKKGMMQQIFSQKLRFKGFSASWNDIKVGSLGTFNSGGTPSKKNSAYWKGDIPWISSSDLTEDSIFEVMTTRYITREAIDNSATKIIPKNSVLIVSRVGVGKVAVNSSQLCTSQDFTSLTPFEDNPVFLAYLLKSKASRLLEFNQGTSIKGFVRDDLINLSVSIPTKEEQTKIADFLTTIDQKIDNVAEQIDHAKTWKKGLLQQMFV
tara:strand:- start:927 stop:2120 length:1194 start_codon:yes stop_codon:yes gene_type:complete